MNDFYSTFMRKSTDKAIWLSFLWKQRRCFEIDIFDSFANSVNRISHSFISVKFEIMIHHDSLRNACRSYATITYSNNQKNSPFPSKLKIINKNSNEYFLFYINEIHRKQFGFTSCGSREDVLILTFLTVLPLGSLP